MEKQKLNELKITATKIRKHIIEEVHSASSGHPGGSLSCTDIFTVLYFDQMNIDPKNAKNPDRDRFVLSKGHCAPALYGTLAQRGFFPIEDLKGFRSAESYLEGHPNMTYVPGVDMSTGSLGQGISAAVGMALAGKLDSKNYAVYSILGDGEIEEGQVWEACMAAAHLKLNNLVAFLDHNGLQIDGKISDVMSPEPVVDKFKAFGWNVYVINGHEYEQIKDAILEAKKSSDKPTMIIAETIKGKDVSFMENAAGWHGSAPNKEQRDQAIAELDAILSKLGGRNYNMAQKIATREAYGNALAEFGSDERIVVLDADLSKSTKTEVFKKKYPERFINMGIAEGNMMSVAAGLATCNKIVFASTFAIFASERACEQIRNSICYPKLNVKVGATHAGISVGEDGASHQCIEDIAIMRSIPNMVVISPCDAVETRLAVKAAIEYDGPVYLRLGRLGVPQLNDESTYKFELGKGVTLSDGKDLTIFSTGLMTQYAVEAKEVLKNEGIDARIVNIHTIKPIDKDIIIKAAKETGAIVTAEEHNVIGGFGSAVAEVVVENYPVPVKMVGVKDKFGKSGKPDKLLEMYGLTTAEIVAKAKEALAMKK